MRIQIVSDLHLEFGPLALPTSHADVLVAAGDIAIGQEGHEWLQHMPCPVIYIAGNHEYWRHDLHGLIQTLTEMSRHGNVYFLENRSLEIGGVRFIGCTLWTDFNGGDPATMEEMSLVMNDFRYISNGARPARPEDLLELNAESRRWLEQELATQYLGKTVVVTHHAPLMRSWYSGRGEDLTRFAYCNDLSELLSHRAVDLWVHGHVHEYLDYSAHGARIVCNPRGYCNYREVPDFEAAKVVSL
jgi:Icc-related predicted phosphoesterase